MATVNGFGYSSEDELQTTDAPNVKELNKEYLRSFVDERVTSRINDNDNVRFAQWEGQSVDGKKHSSELGRAALPWEGASDTRIRSADDTINYVCDLRYLAYKQSRLVVEPIEVNDTTISAASRQFLKWEFDVRSRQHILEELDRFSQYSGQYGHAYMHTGWSRRVDLVPKTITIDQVAEALIASAMLDPDTETVEQWLTENRELFISQILSIFTDVSRQDANQCHKDMLEKGQCEVYVEESTVNQPRIRALRPFYDVLIPPETHDFHRARVVFYREFYTIEELRNKQRAEGWDPEFVDAAEKTSGHSGNFWYNASSPITGDTSHYNEQVNMIEVIWAYSKRINKKGQTAIFLTIFSPNRTGQDSNPETELFAVHKEIEEYQGEYPFRIFTEERTRRNPMESRGIPEIVRTWQNEIKAQADAIVDFTSLATNPPFEKPLRMSQHIRLGPGVQVATARRGDLGFMDPPSPIGVQASLEVMARVQRRIDSRYGIPNPEVDPALTLVRQQAQVNRYMEFVSDVLRSIWRCYQRYGSDQEFARVTGTQIPIPRDIRSFDLNLEFDARELDSDFVEKKIKAVNELVLPMDAGGAIDRAKLIEMQLTYIDPTLPQAVMLAPEQATRKLYDEVLGQVLSMSQGNQAILSENDAAAQTKLQLLSQILENNPRYSQQMESDEQFAQNMQTYVQSLEHSAVQLGENRQIGKYGAQPGAVQSATGI